MSTDKQAYSTFAEITVPSHRPLGSLADPSVMEGGSIALLKPDEAPPADTAAAAGAPTDAEQQDGPPEAPPVQIAAVHNADGQHAGGTPALMPIGLVNDAEVSTALPAGADFQQNPGFENLNKKETKEEHHELIQDINRLTARTQVYGPVVAVIAMVLVGWFF